MRILGLVLVAALACGDDDGTTMPMLDSGPSFPPASMAQLIAFEGHQTLVNEITLGDGVSLEGAVITAEPGPLSVVEQTCTAERCGVVVAVADDTANRGIGVPAPIDAVNNFLQVATTDGQIYRGLLSLQPIDSISNAGAMATVGQDLVIATRLDVSDAAQFFAGTVGPVRWVIFGDAVFGASSFDVSPSDEGPRAGGFAGGAANTAGEGNGGEADGGGGAGRSTDGLAGESGAGGVATPDRGACLSDFSRNDCGGGGGAGAIGEGGDGGGGLVIVSLGSIRGNLSIDATGGAGQSGAGGGGGGDVLLAGTTVEVADVDVSGGPGEGTGGAGGRGAVRVDSPGDSRGVSVRIPDSVLVTSAMLALDGSAPDGASVDVRRDGTSVGTFDATGGTWSGSVELAPGLNRLSVFATIEGVEMRSWTGNGIEIGRIGMRALPLGATLDVVYLP